MISLTAHGASARAAKRRQRSADRRKIKIKAQKIFRNAMTNRVSASATARRRRFAVLHIHKMKALA
jgi:hypothetical protein